MRVPVPIEQDPNASPFNAVPAVAVLIAAAMALIEVGLELGQAGLAGGPQAVGWRVALLERFALSPPLLHWMLQAPERLASIDLLRMLTYPFIHGGFMHMAFAAAILLALGKFVGEVLSGAALLGVWAGSAVAGALVYAFATNAAQPLFGGMPPAYGLVGGFTLLLWRKARQSGRSPWPALRLIAVLIGFQLFYLAFERSSAPLVLADLGGFAGGVALTGLLGPGGARDLRRWLQRP